jgi:sugar O-acyltransferase (sialic acid O-acetyltransferase NeuD family)
MIYMQEKQQVVIFGLGELAQIAHFYFSHDSDHEVVAFTADEKYIKKGHFLGLPAVPFETVKLRYPPEKYGMFIAIGFTNLNKSRAAKYEAAKKKGYTLVSYVSSKLVSWGDTKVGDNCFILENQTIQPFVTIGDDVVIWSGNHIGHHVTIGDHCFITSHVVISGGATIKSYSFVGVNATIRDHIVIEKENIIGMGANIVKNTREKEVYIGLAAQLRSNDSSKTRL